MCQDPVNTKVPAQISSGDNRTRTFVCMKKVRKYVVFGPVSYTHLDVYKRQGYIYVIVPVTGIIIMMFSLMNAADMLHTDFSKKEDAEV